MWWKQEDEKKFMHMLTLRSGSSYERLLPALLPGDLSLYCEDLPKSAMLESHLYYLTILGNESKLTRALEYKDIVTSLLGNAKNNL
jgi:hypothetical protein